MMSQACTNTHVFGRYETNCADGQTLHRAETVAGEAGLNEVKLIGSRCNASRKRGLRISPRARILGNASGKRPWKWTRLPTRRWGSRVLRVTAEVR